MLKKILSASLLALVLVAFAGSAYADHHTQIKYITDIDANAVVTLLPKKGILVVTLESNPTTGYRWLVKSMNPNVLKQVGKDIYKPFKSSAGRVGGGGTQTFVFEALNAGTDDLVLHYSQAPKHGPGQEFKVEVKVGPTKLPPTPIKPQH